MSAAERRPLYTPLGWLLVRAPLLPVEAYLALGGRVPAGRLPPDPRIRAALAVGSANLFDALGRADPAGKDDPDAAGKLLRYLIRMSTRPTPYGLFAGVALARWGPQTDLALAPDPPHTRTRPDMDWLLRVVLELESRPEVRRQLRYRANPRAFIHAGRVFLPETAPMAGGSGPAVSVRATGVVRQALALARSPVPHAQLVAALTATPGATAEKVEALIDGLWRQTVLLTDLRPPLTAPSPAAYVAGRLRGLPAAADALERLEAALAAMAAWDSLPIDAAAAAYRQLATQTGPSLAEEPAMASQMDTAAADAPQVDMALRLRGSQLGRAIATEAVRAAELLLRLTPLPAGLPSLDAYRRAFESRYGPEREVPLLELLDPNFGLGPLSAHFHGGAPGGDPRKAALRQQTLYDLAVSALRDRRLVIELDEDVLTRLESWTPSRLAAPQSLDLSLFVLANSAQDVDEGRFQVVIGPNLGATAAGRNLGRFADLLGADAATALQEVARAEAALQPDGLWAELVYFPHRFRSANVAVRPHSRPYEIALGTTPGRPPGEVIPVDELVVGIRDGRFYVRWPARDAEVLACAGHMLNNMQAPDVCRFLDDLRRDGQAQISTFDWGSAAGLPVLPRVQAGRVVLCPAQWRIDARVRKLLAPDSAAGFIAALGAWRTSWQVPRYVYLSFGDNRLLLDLDNPAQAEELRAELRGLADGAQLLLQEALPAPNHAWVGGPGGRFVTELVVPLVLRPDRGASDAAASRPRCAAATPADRLRPPGSAWLFAKLYCARAFEDDLLTGPVAELCQQALAMGAADDWFFIRYADPDPHLRLRFHGDPVRLIGELAPHICAWAGALVGEGLCTRLGFDTYEREVERFGGTAGMDAAEAIFGADSRAVIELLRLSREGLLQLDMTSLAVLSIDRLLAGLGADEAERLAWYRERVTARTLAGDDYRRRKEVLRRLLGDSEHIRAQPGGDALARVLAARGDALAPLGRRLETLAAAGELSQPKGALFSAYVHLHCNRLMAGDRSAEEQVLALLGRTRYGLRQAPVAARTDMAEAAATA
ncbi:lantibiotic dehydratase [Limobrevibacterium gyesilva]|uniref:Lantibiotic dehydratase n=1 Tax=Limobrevibacterium gyesilva TaxID=2991712 RepID=A0AA42CHF0_9PROT|nr:lantibiotic dehydratase [Limobrevibacterium gyesilva]MCW3474785.1 lantibiotic dehydratase [Limobrevibacterium gyesilva]